MLQGIKRSGGIRATNLVEQYMNGGKILLPVIDPLNIVFGLVIVLTSGLAVTFYGCWRAGDQSAIQLINSKM
jgi:ABC-type lipoprotein release transport system permease subunit